MSENTSEGSNQNNKESLALPIIIVVIVFIGIIWLIATTISDGKRAGEDADQLDRLIKGQMTNDEAEKFRNSPRMQCWNRCDNMYTKHSKTWKSCQKDCKDMRAD